MLIRLGREEHCVSCRIFYLCYCCLMVKKMCFHLKSLCISTIVTKYIGLSAYPSSIRRPLSMVSKNKICFGFVHSLSVIVSLYCMFLRKTLCSLQHS